MTNVYTVRVLLKGKRTYVPMQALEVLGGLWTIGYVTPSGSHKKYKASENYTDKEQNKAECRLNEMAAARGWAKWPEDLPKACYAESEMAKSKKEGGKMRTEFTALRLARLRCGYTSTKPVAEKAGIPYTRLSLFEAGQPHRRLNPDELARVADVLSVPVETIADERGYPVMSEIV